ncbi:MAG: S-methyl-5-thioribose-1-phosphate isomerase [Verrucomicrobiia bacterium]
MKVHGKDYRAVWMNGPSPRKTGYGHAGHRDVVVINQTLLPHRFKLLRLKNHRETARAIATMIVRGAGTIGATAAYGMAQAVIEAPARGFSGYLEQAYRRLLHTRPTAVDLKHAIDRVHGIATERDRHAAVAEAERIADEYVERSRRIGEVGLPLIRNGTRVLTHCNAGWLALVDWGSATAPIYLAHRKGRKVFVWVDETRPRNQGTNLTSWELLNEGVPHKIITDNAGGFYMQRGEVDLCIVGADRIAANGDTANKIGTYQKAVLAHENGIPFYVAAPSSTIDWKCPMGANIPIEERDEDEVRFMSGIRLAPRGARAANPGFDVTPAKFITGIITEQGIVKPGELRRLR